ncbi:MAG: ATP-binding cassette domain-containing protein [Candidatus Methanoplasma sp.]|jgi:iron complex transport system ATP-binding protein|nr:ATP-binding cassette domain-containing protein [Candidatus Methanoplasma sp.]
MKALSMRNVSVVRGGSRILDSVSLDIDEGENVAILGRNGSGKTTLVRLLRGEVRPYYDESDPPRMSIFGEEDWDLFSLRRSMGVVSMDLQSAFGGGTTVAEAVASGFFGAMDVFRNTRVTAEMAAAAHRSARLMGMEDLMDRRMDTLSLGEARRALIARAMVTDPRVLVLDEPMTGLDIVMASRFRRMFDLLAGRGVGIVMVTHDPSDIPECVRRVVLMREGAVFADGPKEEVLASETVSAAYGERINVGMDMGVYHMRMGDAPGGSDP